MADQEPWLLPVADVLNALADGVEIVLRHEDGDLQVFVGTNYMLDDNFWLHEAVLNLLVELNLLACETLREDNYGYRKRYYVKPDPPEAMFMYQDKS